MYLEPRIVMLHCLILFTCRNFNWKERASSKHFCTCWQTINIFFSRIFIIICCWSSQLNYNKVFWSVYVWYNKRSRKIKKWKNVGKRFRCYICVTPVRVLYVLYNNLYSQALNKDDDGFEWYVDGRLLLLWLVCSEWKYIMLKCAKLMIIVEIKRKNFIGLSACC